MNEVLGPEMPIEEVARYPLPGMVFPAEIQFSPDDQLITFLYSPEGDLVRYLYAFNPETGERRLLVTPLDGDATEEKVSLEEALRRERQRQRELGVTSYAWADKTNSLLIPLQDGLYVMDHPDAPLHKLIGNTDKPVLDPQFSPDGRWVAYVQDGELWAIPTGGGKPRQLTHGARSSGKTHGLAEYIAQEEMARKHGFWWSPDSQRIAFVEVDETHIPIYRVVHQGKALTGEDAQEDHRYPFAGQANARVRLGVVSLKGARSDQEPVWMDLGSNADIYLARIRWLPDGNLSAQLENREQTRLELARFDPETGRRTTILWEVNEVWINLHHMFKPLSEDQPNHGGGFIWASERSGFRHLYLYDRDGNLIRPLTQGEWLVDDIAAVDETRELIYFLGTYDGPTERHLYVVPFTGSTPRRLTPEPGTHTVVIDHNFQRFVDIHHALDRSPMVTLRSLRDGALISKIHEEVDPRINTLELTSPELVTFPNRDGILLYGAIYRPPEQFGFGPYPTIVWVYGGPHVQLVVDGWSLTVAMRAQYLSKQGFLVFVLDNRGSAGRGLSFEKAVKNDLGNVEVEDQVDGVRWLVEQGLADPDRVGVYGWSYGGYMAAMCLARAPETFRVAVAGAPVTSWDGYDTHYTERYMSTPQLNPEGYARSSVFQHVENIKGRLMLVHGLIDENVHFRHTARLVNALTTARKPYNLLLFPDERHMPRKETDRVYMEECIRDFFFQHL